MYWEYIMFWNVTATAEMTKAINDMNSDNPGRRKIYVVGEVVNFWDLHYECFGASTLLGINKRLWESCPLLVNTLICSGAWECLEEEQRVWLWENSKQFTLRFTPGGYALRLGTFYRHPDVSLRMFKLLGDGMTLNNGNSYKIVFDNLYINNCKGGRDLRAALK